MKEVIKRLRKEKKAYKGVPKWVDVRVLTKVAMEKIGYQIGMKDAEENLFYEDFQYLLLLVGTDVDDTTDYYSVFNIINEDFERTRMSKPIFEFFGINQSTFEESGIDSSNIAEKGWAAVQKGLGRGVYLAYFQGWIKGALHFWNEIKDQI